MELNLRGRTAFITGANRGIGKAIARALAREGVNGALFGRNLEQTEGVAAELRAAHQVNMRAVSIDLTEKQSIIRAVAEAIGVLGKVDILVNSAGGATRGTFEDIADETWEECFAVKPFGLIRMTRATLPHLRTSDQARIINLAGTRGPEPSAVSPVSSPINAATLAITKVMANALGPQGITVNAINPGTTDSRRFGDLIRVTMEQLGLSHDEAERHILHEVPLGRAVKVEDVADLAVYLASARAGMITGTAINIDGGRTRSV